MRQLIEMRLFSLAKQSVQKEISQEELKNAYDEFALTLHQFWKPKEDLSFSYCKLGYTLLEIDDLKGKTGKKCSSLLSNKSHFFN